MYVCTTLCVFIELSWPSPVSIHMYVSIYVVCMNLCVFMYVCMYVCMYVWLECEFVIIVYVCTVCMYVEFWWQRRCAIRSTVCTPGRISTSR